MRPTSTGADAGPPPYAVPASFVETDVTAGTAEWPLPATLATPVGDGPFPAVVLVHGSGAQDRDASIGPNRLFRDIAHGLASRGIVVLRHEKRFQHYESDVPSMAPFTVREEAIDDALAGVALLRQTARVDPAQVFVLGHSLGGMLAPRIAAADPDLAGLIVMAGAVRPIEQSIVEQTRYLLMADGEFTNQDREQLLAAERLVAEVRALGPDNVSATEWVGGAPPSYWLDLRGYDPPQVASRLPHAFLVLQGERDYQVTMADFARWRAALESRANVTLRSYPSLNHVFMGGEGPSLPSEYLTPGHVSPSVVDDIARWVLAAAASRQ
jgi:dienelactone hydrolase